MLVQSKFSLEACFQVGYERNPVGCVVDQGNDVNRMFGPRLMSTRPARALMEQAGTKCVIQCEVRIESADTICVLLVIQSGQVNFSGSSSKLAI